MLPHDELRSMVERFSRFAGEARHRSPLYVVLSEGIAEDPSTASVLAAASGRQQRPNLLFAAVHDVLLEGAEHELRHYYPSVGGTTPPNRRAMLAFRSFVDEHRQAIVSRVAHRKTQTNEPGRCAAIRPALSRVASMTSWPVALVELGASAGLLLHLDRYRYRYGHGQPDVGPPGAAVVIDSEVRGTAPPRGDLPTITRRLGIDLNPLFPADEADARWLRACVWPDDVDRMSRLDAALRTAQEHDDVELLRGNVVTDLPPVVADVPDDMVVCVIHSAALAYLDEQDRATVQGHLDRIGSERDLFRICFEGPFVEPFATQEQADAGPTPDEERFLVGLSAWTGGDRRDELLCRSQPHGAWIEWLSA